MSGKGGQDKLNGIFRYLEDHRHWDCTIIRTSDSLTTKLIESMPCNGVRGLIFSLPSHEAVLKRIVLSNTPTVIMDILDAKILHNRKEHIAFVANDSDAIGTCAAEYLLGLTAFRSYAYVGPSQNFEWSRIRREAFCRMLDEYSRKCSVYSDPVEPSKNSMEVNQRRLAKWLQRLPKPAGILASHDYMGLQVLETCRSAGLKVPDEVSVLGVNNEEIVCEHTIPTLSSVQPDFEQEGYIAASLLDQIMQGIEVQRKKTVLCGVKQIVARRSTMPTSTSAKLIQNAADFIRANACKGIGVMDVVKNLRVSRRLADLRFHQLRGHTILDAICRQRLDQVKRLLTGSALSIGEIGEHCGYQNENYLKNLFKSRFGLTMRDYRKRNR